MPGPAYFREMTERTVVTSGINPALVDKGVAQAQGQSNISTTHSTGVPSLPTRPRAGHIPHRAPRAQEPLAHEKDTDDAQPRRSPWREPVNPVVACPSRTQLIITPLIDCYHNKHEDSQPFARSADVAFHRSPCQMPIRTGDPSVHRLEDDMGIEAGRPADLPLTRTSALS
jgi:hypothetical protein